MEQIISKEEFNNLMKIKGEVRGRGIREPMNFVFEREGENGLKKIEDTMIKLGFPLKYQEIKENNLYPIKLLAITLLVMKRLFDYDDKNFQDMGKMGAKLSMLVRIFMKYFVSLKKIVTTIPEYWRKYYTIGEARLIEFDEKKRYIILRIENFPYFPAHCDILKGYFSGVVQMVVKSQVFCKEIKCPRMGDKYHEFIVEW